MIHVLKLAYVLDPKVTLNPANPIRDAGKLWTQRTSLIWKKKKALRREFEELCVGHIKNSLSYRLYDLLCTGQRSERAIECFRTQVQGT